MRSFLVALATVALASTASAQDAPPPPDEPPPAVLVPPLPPEAGEVPAPPIEPPVDPKEPGFTPVPKPKAKDKAPPAPDAPVVGFGGDACWGSAVACVGGGCLPGAGTALGATILVSTISAGISEGGCGGVVLVILGTVYGIIIGAPAALLLGPCASCSAAAGGFTLAALNDRDTGPVMIGSIPGIALGLLGTGGVIWGLAALDGANGDFTIPAALLGAGVGLSLLSGPATIAGIAIADGMAGVSAEDPAKKARPTPDDPRKDPGTATVAMRY